MSEEDLHIDDIKAEMKKVWQQFQAHENYHQSMKFFDRYLQLKQKHDSLRQQEMNDEQ